MTLPNTEDLLARFDGFKGATQQSLLQELLDREEIRELTFRYAQRIARRESAADMFTDDGAFIFRVAGSSQEARGRDKLEQTFAQIVSKPDPNFPTVHNHVISVSGDQAVGLCWIELHTKIDGTEFAGSGYYQDEFRRERGRWKFVVRDSTLVKWGPVR